MSQSTPTYTVAGDPPLYVSRPGASWHVPPAQMLPPQPMYAAPSIGTITGGTGANFIHLPQTPGGESIVPTIPDFNISAETPPEGVLNRAASILHIEESARKQAPFKAAIIERLEELLTNEKWLAEQPDPEHIKLEIEKRIKQLKGIDLENALGGLLG